MIRSLRLAEAMNARLCHDLSGLVGTVCGMLQLEVSDDGPGMVNAPRLTNGRGVGIRNTCERLQVLYGERGKVQVTNTEPGLRVALTFPAESGAAPA